MAIFQVTSVKEFTFSFLSQVPLLLKKSLGKNSTGFCSNCHQMNSKQ